MINLRQLIDDLVNDQNEKVNAFAVDLLDDAEKTIASKIRADVRQKQWAHAIYEDKNELTPVFLREIYNCLVENFSNKTQLSFEYKQAQTAPIGAGAFTPGKYYINFYITKDTV